MKRQINKIYIFGDSILKGVMYNKARSRYVICKENRFEPIETKGIMINNYSQMGYTASCGFEYMKSKINRDNCDANTLVIIEFGGNDSDHKWKEVSRNPEAEHLPITSRKELKNIYSQMIDYVSELGASVVCCNLIPICSEKYMNWISQDLSRENILKWLGDEDILYRWQETYNKVIEQIAVNKGVELIDIRTPFLLSHEFENMIGDDGIHPSDSGHKIIGKTICDFILCHCA